MVFLLVTILYVFLYSTAKPAKATLALSGKASVSAVHPTSVPATAVKRPDASFHSLTVLVVGACPLTGETA